ncbi:MAG: hypothetical protein KGH96_23650 [Sphingomonadales bacterium]|nr:hypothetical protein [Sphingomonadales bacterium]
MGDELIKLDAPEGAELVSWGGVEYAVENGSVQVPAAAIGDLASHGFSLPKPRKGKTAEACA